MQRTRSSIGFLLMAFAAIAVAATLAYQPRAAANDDSQKTAACTLKVSGMTCGGCAAVVKSAAKKVDGVTDAKVSYEKGLAEVTYDPAKTTPAAIAKAVTDRSGFKTEVQTPARNK